MKVEKCELPEHVMLRISQRLTKGAFSSFGMVWVSLFFQGNAAYGKSLVFFQDEPCHLWKGVEGVINEGWASQVKNFTTSPPIS